MPQPTPGEKHPIGPKTNRNLLGILRKDRPAFGQCVRKWNIGSGEGGKILAPATPMQLVFVHRLLTRSRHCSRKVERLNSGDQLEKIQAAHESFASSAGGLHRTSISPPSNEHAAITLQRPFKGSAYAVPSENGTKNQLLK